MRVIGQGETQETFAQSQGIEIQLNPPALHTKTQTPNVNSYVTTSRNH
jgi:hypothetical protein